MSSFIFRDLLEGPWKVYENSLGRIFYHNSELKKSSWKPPRKYKPARTRVLSEEDQEGSAKKSGVHDVIIPMGFVELHDITSGIYFPIARHWVTSLFQEKSFMKTSRVGIDGSRPGTRRVDSTFTALTLTPWKPGQSGLCPLSTHQHWTRSISSHTLECEWNPKLLCSINMPSLRRGETIHLITGRLCGRGCLAGDSNKTKSGGTVVLSFLGGLNCEKIVN